MPWSEGPNLGFSTGTPWLPAAAEHAGLSVAAQDPDPGSMLNLARELIALRKASPALSTGGQDMLETPDPVLGFVRREGGEAIACLFNMGAEDMAFPWDGPKLGDFLFGLEWAETHGGTMRMGGYAVAFIKLA